MKKIFWFNLPCGQCNVLLSFLFCLSIDATLSTGLGRLVNDSPPHHANCKMKLLIVNQTPNLFLFSTKMIPSGTELRYDYADHNSNLKWREKVLKQNYTWLS